MTTDTRTTLNLPADMTRLIDNYWHSEQLRSRNEAIRELLAYALEQKTGRVLLVKEQRR